MKLIDALISLPKTIYFNFKVFPVETAVKLPVFVHYNLKIGSLYRGAIEFDSCAIKPRMVLLGCTMGSAGVFDGPYPKSTGGGYISLQKGCKLIFQGNACFAGGISIRVDNGGIIQFGDNFACNSYCFLAPNSTLIFGRDCMLGWKINIRDADGHPIYGIDNENEILNKTEPIIIGNHVWISSHATILKGSHIPDNCIVAWGAIVSGKKFEDKNCIIAGVPAKIIKTGIEWKH